MVLALAPVAFIASADPSAATANNLAEFNAALADSDVNNITIPAGATILVPAPVVIPNRTLTIQGTGTIQADPTAFAGTEVLRIEAAANVTILGITICGGDEATTYSNVNMVLITVGATGQVTLDGVTVQSAHRGFPNAITAGHGIDTSGADVRILNGTVQDFNRNGIDQRVGGLYVYNTDVIGSGSIGANIPSTPNIIQNGIVVRAGTAELTGNRIRDLRYDGPYPASPYGLIVVGTGSVEATGNEFRDMDAGIWFASSGTLILQSSTFTDVDGYRLVATDGIITNRDVFPLVNLGPGVISYNGNAPADVRVVEFYDPDGDDLTFDGVIDNPIILWANHENRIPAFPNPAPRAGFTPVWICDDSGARFRPGDVFPVGDTKLVLEWRAATQGGAGGGGGAVTVQTPSVPRNLTATPGDGSVTLNWIAPANIGSSAIVRYEISVDGGDWIRVGNVLTYTITGLTNGQSHTFRARAVNNQGAGAIATVTVTPVAEEDDPDTPDQISFPFTDAETHWAREAIAFVFAEGLMEGVSGMSFAPDAPLTRAMVATILWRMAGSPEVADGTVFDDVAGARWYTQAIAWAYQNGIVQGFGDGRFAPGQNITREQFAAVMFRYARFIGGNTGVSEGFELYRFHDRGQLSGWAVPYKYWANYSGLITGTTSTTLSPQGNATRAEAATILMRFLAMGQ